MHSSPRHYCYQLAKVVTTTLFVAGLIFSSIHLPAWATTVGIDSLSVTSTAYSGVRGAGGAAFGPTIASLPGAQLSGEVVHVGLGCDIGSYLGDPNGKIALVERGTCTFVAKVRNAQDAGAIGVIVYNGLFADPESIVTMGGTDPSIVIPSVFVARSTGILLRDGAAPVTATITSQTIDISGFPGSTSTTVGSNTVITGTDDSGNVVSVITLPQGTVSTGGSIEYIPSGANSMVQISGIIVPYPPGKSIMTKSNPGTSRACVIDSPASVSLEGLSCRTDLLESKVLLDCSEAGTTTSISGFPDIPTTREYTCTKVFQNDQHYIQVAGLVNSALVIDGTPPVITFEGGINNGDKFAFGTVPAAPTCTAVDDLSDVDGPCLVTGYSTETGLHTLTATAADTSGNVAIATLDYEVLSPAIVDVHPKVINKQAKGEYVTLYIEFDESCPGCDVRDIDVSTVTLQAIDPVTSEKLPVAAGSPTEVGDGNGNGVVDRMVKFDRAFIHEWFAEGTGQVTFRVEGRFLDGQQFEGTDASVTVN